LASSSVQPFAFVQGWPPETLMLQAGAEPPVPPELLEVTPPEPDALLDDVLAPLLPDALLDDPVAPPVPDALLDDPVAPPVPDALLDDPVAPPVPELDALRVLDVAEPPVPPPPPPLLCVQAASSRERGIASVAAAHSRAQGPEIVIVEPPRR
jgi:hypothetical protein